MEMSTYSSLRYHTDEYAEQPKALSTEAACWAQCAAHTYTPENDRCTKPLAVIK